jgi:hypothetical protein
LGREEEERKRERKERERWTLEKRFWKERKWEEKEKEVGRALDRETRKYLRKGKSRSEQIRK